MVAHLFHNPKNWGSFVTGIMKMVIYIYTYMSTILSTALHLVGGEYYKHVDMSITTNTLTYTWKERHWTDMKNHFPIT